MKIFFNANLEHKQTHTETLAQTQEHFIGLCIYFQNAISSGNQFPRKYFLYIYYNGHTIQISYEISFSYSYEAITQSSIPSKHTYTDQRRIIKNKHFDCFIFIQIKKKENSFYCPYICLATSCESINISSYDNKMRVFIN